MSEGPKTAEQLIARHKKQKAKLPVAGYEALVADRKAFGVHAKNTSADTAVALQKIGRDPALQRAYKFIEGLRPGLQQRILRALNDEKDPLHALVVDSMIKRALPAEFFNALGKQEFRPEEEQQHRPMIVINVTGGAGAEVVKPADVVDVEPVEKGE